ncbi:MAG: CBS domain-containing protein [Candidatus Bathyarchaeota archaeon]|nr:CBS domain-containing protein [Candidatus Bathyarchaeota archaeon]MDH5686635.1 CBS domain-containing protein [Candidatus Bathyarchaeota archaeon]
MKVAEAMRKEIVTVDEEVSVAEASEMMRERGEGGAIILRKGTPVGMMTERDVTYKVTAEALDARRVKVAEIMETPLIVIDPDADLVEAAKIMDEHKIRRLAVVRKGVIYGVLRAIDIARNLERHTDNEIRKILRYAFFVP